MKTMIKLLSLFLTLTVLLTAMMQPSFAYRDVSVTEWYADVVREATEKGLFNGTGNDCFAPESGITRAMLTTVLYRMAGEPAVSGGMPVDVRNDAYYANAACWAIQNSIVSSSFADPFLPDEKIARQDMASMLFRYANLNHKYQGAGSLAAFRDRASVSYSANSAVCFAVGVGILKGDEASMLHPQSIATRAEAAAVLLRYLDFLEGQKTLDAPKISHKQSSLTVGDSMQLTATFDSSAGQHIWETSNASVARVSADGVVTAISSGTAIITARACNGQTVLCLITVKARFSLQCDTYDMTVGETGLLTTASTPATASVDVTWSSSAPTIVSVDNGKITACDVGTAQISAETAAGDIAVCTVTVTDNGEDSVFTEIKSYLRTNGSVHEDGTRYLRRIYSSDGISYTYAISYFPGEETLDLILTADDDIIADIVIDKALSGHYAFSVIYQGLYVTEGTLYASIFNGIIGADIRVTENSNTLSDADILSSTNSILKLDAVLGNRILKLTGHTISDFGFTAIANELE